MITEKLRAETTKLASVEKLMYAHELLADVAQARVDSPEGQELMIIMRRIRRVLGKE